MAVVIGSMLNMSIWVSPLFDDDYLAGVDEVGVLDAVVADQFGHGGAESRRNGA